MLFQPHPYLSYSRSDTFYRDDGIQIGDQFYTFHKPDDVVRIACLGGSTTMQTHPLYMKEYLELDFDDVKYEVMDFGCNSWTSQESLINYLLRVQDFDPDYMILHHGINDMRPRVYPKYYPDYSHFRSSWSDQTGSIIRYGASFSFTVNSILYFKGITPFDIQNYVCQILPASQYVESPAIETMRSFKRNIDTISTLATTNNTTVILAPISYQPELLSKSEINMVEQHINYLLEYAKNENIISIDTRWIFQNNTDVFIDPVHLNREGIQINTILFSTIIRDHLRGYSVVINEDEEAAKKQIHQFNKIWIPQRRIQIKWSLNIPNIQEYHIYFREPGSTQLNFLASTNSPDIHTLDWIPGNSVIKDAYRSGPVINKEYWFNVFAITEEQPYPSVGHQTINNVFEIDDRIVFQEASTLN